MRSPFMPPRRAKAGRDGRSAITALQNLPYFGSTCTNSASDRRASGACRYWKFTGPAMSCS